jgi:hypothetical protein
MARAYPPGPSASSRLFARLALLILLAAFPPLPPASPFGSVGTAAAEETKPLSGRYRVAAHRRASNVAAPLDVPSWKAEPGEVEFGTELSWPSGTVCTDWEAAPLEQTPLDLSDPMLSDVMLGPHPGPRSTGDHRLNQAFEIRCAGERPHPVVAVDARVLIMPSPDGAIYAILERPLETEQVRRLQRQLRDMKFYDGEPTGTLDAPTQDAIAAYAEYRGALYRFSPPVITENLLDGLGVLE